MRLLTNKNMQKYLLIGYKKLVHNLQLSGKKLKNKIQNSMKGKNPLVK